MAGYNTEELDRIGQIPNIGANQLPRDLTLVHMRELDQEWADRMEFNEEELTIRILPPNERNPPRWVACAVNGIGCEIWSEKNKRWDQWFQVPVNVIFTTKRKYVENLLRSRITRITLADPDVNPNDHTIYRDTTSVYSLDIIKDKNPDGRVWVEDIRRQMV